MEDKMKMRLAVALGALVALCAGTASGQTFGNWGQRNQPTQSATTPTVPAVRVNVSGGVNPTDTTFVPFQFDVNGNLKTSEQFPLSSLYSYQPSVISAIFSSAPEAYTQVGVFEKVDSTAVIDCTGYNRAALLMYPSPTLTSEKGGGSGDSLMGGIFAIQARGHNGVGADSLSTFIIPPGIGRSQAAGTQFSDSVGSITDMVNNSSSMNGALPVRNRPFASEKLVVVSMTGTSALPGAVANSRGMLVWVNKVGDGSLPGLFPKMSWRVRYLKSYTNVAGVPTAVADSISAGANGGLPMRARFDLVLWRE